MAHGPTFRVPFRRRREQRTDYRQRLGLLRSGETRVVVRRANNSTSVQFIDFDPQGDQVRAAARSTDLAKYGWTGHGGNLPASYLTGLLAGKRALANGVDEAVLDVGLQKPQPGTGLFAVVQGLVDAGVHVPHGDGVVPDEDRLAGRHISDEVAAAFEATKTKIEEADA